MTRLAIVPARGGSKRIPGKNVRDFCGTPMIGHILGTARDSGLFDTIHVSTESATIAGIAKALGFPVDFLRPANLAGDGVGLMPVLKYVLDEYRGRGRSFSQIWLLMACAPLVTAQDLIGAEKVFVDAGGRSDVLAVAEFRQPIEWALKRSDNNRFVPAQKSLFNVHSQHLDKSYFDTGSFCIYPPETVDNLVLGGSGNGFVGYVVPKGSAIDIDDEADWQFAEALYRVRMGASTAT